MSDKYDGPYKNRLIEIDERIERLNKRIPMWSKAGGGKMAMQGIGEINELKREKARILDGSQVKIDEIQRKIGELKKLREQCKIINFMKKANLDKEINKFEIEKNSLMRR